MPRLLTPGLSSDADIVGEIVHALSSKWLSFGPSELDEYEKLLEQKPEDEPSLHAFFERYPQMLDPMTVQVWSKPDFHGYKEPDFLIRRSDNSYLVIEIENAAKSIMTQANQPSAYVTQAVKQVNEYRFFLLEKTRRTALSPWHYSLLVIGDGLPAVVLRCGSPS